MKIKSVRFLNLNALRGEHEVSFDAAPLNESGLFAITGPTGAGKTTILDAITLGLYGRVNRHDRDLPSEIMSRHTAEAYSEVTFEARNEIYRAKWSVYRSRKKADGNLQPIKMELCRVADGIFLDLKSHEVPVKVSELCGLDYSQFLRSVMLSQGEFTRFLKANDNERSELLERITDTAIYSDISRQAYRRAASEKSLLQQFKSELSGQELLAPELLKEFELKLESEKERELQLKANRTEKDLQITWLKELDKLTLRKAESEQALQSLEENAVKYQPDFARLEQHKLAVAFRPELVKLESAQASLSEIRQQKELLSAQIPALIQATEAASQQAEQAQLLQLSAEKALREAIPMLDEVFQKDSVLENMRRQFQKGKDAYKVFEADFNKNVTEVEKHRNVVSGLKSKLSELQTWLSVHASEKDLAGELPLFERHLSDLQRTATEAEKHTKEKAVANTIIQDADKLLETSGKRLEQLLKDKQETEDALNKLHEESASLLQNTSENELETALQELPFQLNQLERLYQLAQNLQTLVEKGKELIKQKDEESEKVKMLQALEKDLTDKVQIARDLFEKYQEIVELQLQIQNYEEARQHLKPGFECPLCGALEHPFAKGFTPKLSDATEKRNAQQIVVEGLGKELAQTTSALAALQANLKASERALQENESSSGIIQTEFSDVSLKFGETYLVNDISGLDQGRINFRNEYAKKKKTAESLKTLRQQQQQLTEKQFRLERENLSETSKMEQTAERVKSARIALENSDVQLSELRKQYTSISAEATSFVSRFGFEFSAGKGIALAQVFRQMAKTFAQNSDAFQQTELSLTKAKGELDKVEATQSQKQTQLNELQESLRAEHLELTALKSEREALFGQKDPAEERKRLTTELDRETKETEAAKNTSRQQAENLKLVESRLEQLNYNEIRAEESVKLYQTELEAKLQAQSIASIVVLKQYFLADEEALRLSNLKTEQEKLLTETRQTLSDTISDLKKEQAKNLTSETVASLIEALQKTEQEISEANRQIGSIAQILKRETELQEKHKELAVKISVQQKEAERWEKLSELIGSESGKKFSKFAQGLTLSKLVALANRHLLKLNDRYQLQKAPGADLELQMVDSYQADAIRSVNTLSGGESFLVSLALALGLSDLASHKTQIDSLFIDEGFGTLDSETLDVAITALENLQAGGKMIGIISHVEALKERISTQIRVKKMSGGVSQIEVGSFAEVI